MEKGPPPVFFPVTLLELTWFKLGTRTDPLVYKNINPCVIITSLF